MSPNTATPIQHVIVIIGENRTFDHVFATYKPVAGQTVNNLLSEGIVNNDGTPSPNFAVAHQSQATDSKPDKYMLSRGGSETFDMLPPVLAGGYTTPPFTTVQDAMAVENGLPNSYYAYLTTGGTGLNHRDVDTRIPNATRLPPGPFQLTTPTHPYDVSDNSPVHRFYQMWQQMDCNPLNATPDDPLVACMISSPGSKSPLVPDRTASLSLPASTTKPPKRAPPRWAFTTCSRVTRPT